MDVAPTFIAEALANHLSTAASPVEILDVTGVAQSYGNKTLKGQILIIPIAQAAAAGVISNAVLSDNQGNIYTRRAQFPDPYNGTIGVEIWTTTISRDDDDMVLTVGYTNPDPGVSMDIYTGVAIYQYQYPGKEFDAIGKGQLSTSSVYAYDEVFVSTDADAVVGIVVADDFTQDWIDNGTPNCFPEFKTNGVRSACSIGVMSNVDGKALTQGLQGYYFNAVKVSNQYMITISIAPPYIKIDGISPVHFIQ